MKISIKWKSCSDNKPTQSGRYLLCFQGIRKDNGQPVYDWCEGRYDHEKDAWYVSKIKNYTHVKLYRWGCVTLPPKPSENHP